LLLTRLNANQFNGEIMKKIIVLLSVLLASILCWGQGFHYLTGPNNHTLLYGRFEVRMKIVAGSGICNALCPIRDVSAGDLDPDWSEMDIEILGDDPSVIESVAHMGNNRTFEQRPWCWQLSKYDFGLDEDYHTYTIEWGPYHVRWGMDGVIFREAVEIDYAGKKQIHDITYDLNWHEDIRRDTIYESNFLAFWRERKMRFAFDLWDASRQFPDWAGPWDPANNSKAIIYSWFKHYTYTPGAGDFGSDYTLHAWDDFDGNKSDNCSWANVYGINYQDGKAVGNLGSWSGSPPPDPGDTSANKATPFPYEFEHVTSTRSVKASTGDLWYSAGIIKCSIAKPGNIALDLYSLDGRLVKTLVNNFKSAGTHTYTPDFSSVPSGTYMLALKTPTQKSVQKMVKISQ
jgi:hypothetical protein